VPHDESFFWATHQQAEIDLILRRGDRLIGIECKREDAPKMTTSIKNALDDLELSEVIVVYPGKKAYPISENVRVIPATSLAEANSGIDF